MPRAPRQCPSPGCPNRITTTRYCPDHTTHNWSSSDRHSRLPTDWRRRRTIVRDRAGGRCEATMANGTRCPEAGTDCDHIIRGDDHSLENLAWLCRWHHTRKTQHEATQARNRNSTNRAAHPAAKHPGLK